MEVRACRINTNGTLEPIALDDAVMSDGLRDRWIDLIEPGKEALDELLEGLGIPAVVRESVLAGSSHRGFDRSERCFVVRFTALTDAHDQTRFISFVCLPDVLISIHREPSAALQHTLERLRGTLRLASPTKTHLLLAIMTALYIDNLDEGFAVRDGVTELFRLIDEDRKIIPTEAIVDLNRRYGQFAATCEDQLYIALCLHQIHPDVFRSEEETRVFRDIAPIQFEFAMQFMERLEARLSSLQEQTAMRLEQVANYRLRFLAIVSAVFAPLTVIAGIYGMNFKIMPELKWTFGYPAVILFMLVTTGGTLFYFYRQGWFK